MPETASNSVVSKVNPGRPPEIGVNQQHARIVGPSRKCAREVDCRQRLAFAGSGARDGDHLERPPAAEPLDGEPQALVLFRRK